MNKKRYLTKNIADDLKSKMVFLSGPRQVGKTTLALGLLGSENEKHPAYLNWDSVKNRKQIMAGEIPDYEKLIVLDEIHKFSKWRNLIKGLYDTNKSTTSFLITGSAKLNVYSRGGDSLQGRYHNYRLHPLTIDELHGSKEDISTLLKFGGFPEPFYSQNTRTWRRWTRDRNQLLINEDIKTLERVRELHLIELLLEALPSKVGSPLSIRSLAEDLQVADNTVKNWIQILENLYFCYRLPPYGAPKIKAVKKEQKLYLWDWSTCLNDGAKFENLVAGHLNKFCHFLEDTEGHSMELRYFRDASSREVDFIILKDKQPIIAIEAKLNEENISPNLFYLEQRTEIPHLFQVHLAKKDYKKSGSRCRSIPFEKMMAILPTLLK